MSCHAQVKFPPLLPVTVTPARRVHEDATQVAACVGAAVSIVKPSTQMDPWGKESYVYPLHGLTALILAVEHLNLPTEHLDLLRAGHSAATPQPTRSTSIGVGAGPGTANKSDCDTEKRGLLGIGGPRIYTPERVRRHAHLRARVCVGTHI